MSARPAAEPVAKPVPKPALWLVVLAGLMLFTRFPPLSGLTQGLGIHLLDASWALFFAGGAFCAARTRWMLPALMVWATAIDLAAVQWFGIPNYCLTAAYAFLIPTHALLWAAGFAASQVRSWIAGGLIALAGAVGAFLLSNGSFYWLGGRVSPTLSGWVDNLADWGPTYVGMTLAYVLLGTMVWVSHKALRQRKASALP